MPVAWNEGSMPFLKKQLENGNVVLFAGAGFSADCTRVSNAQPPLGGKLSALLAERAGLPYNGEPLSVVYAAVERTIGSQALCGNPRRKRTHPRQQSSSKMAPRQ